MGSFETSWPRVRAFDGIDQVTFLHLHNVCPFIHGASLFTVLLFAILTIHIEFLRNLISYLCSKPVLGICGFMIHIRKILERNFREWRGKPVSGSSNDCLGRNNILAEKVNNISSTACSLDIRLYWTVKMLIFWLPGQI